MDFDIEAALEMAAEANNEAQTPIMAVAKPGSSTVSAHRVTTARHILTRFLELAPDDLSVRDLREMLEC